MPEKRSMTSTFLKHIEDCGMKFEKIYIDDEECLGTILEDKSESKKLYEDLKGLKIVLYEITKNN
jgi:hypothetical protein